MPASRRPSVDLPAPDGPDHGDPLAGADVEVDAVQHVAALDVGEPHVLGVELLADAAARPVTSRSSGTSPTPSSRASDAAPTWSSSRIETIRSTGSISICT